MLKPSLLRFLIRLQRQYQLAGPLLTLGVQDILCQYHEAETLLRSEGVEPAIVPERERHFTTSLHVRQTGGNGAQVHARTFFRMAGLSEYDDLDASDSERPTLVHDLNEPVPVAWHGRFNWILDGGTTEHVFNVASALSNLVRLTRIGGHVLHISPMSGWVNHGFYQMSPCLYYDFYGCNGFEPVISFFATNLETGGLNFMPYQYSTGRVQVAGDQQRVNFVFLARKVAGMDRIVNPTQSKYLDRLPVPGQRMAC